MIRALLLEAALTSCGMRRCDSKMATTRYGFVAGRDVPSSSVPASEHRMGTRGSTNRSVSKQMPSSKRMQRFRFIAGERTGLTHDHSARLLDNTCAAGTQAHNRGACMIYCIAV